MKIIRQIMPPEGWRAFYCAEKPNRTGSRVFSEPLVGWALLEEDAYGSFFGNARVVGLTTRDGGAGPNRVECPEEDDNFLGYLSPDDEPHAKDILRDAVEALDERRKQSQSGAPVVPVEPAASPSIEFPTS